MGVVVAAYVSNHRIQRFTPESVFVSKWVTLG